MKILKQVIVAIFIALLLMTIGLLLFVPILGMWFNDELAVIISIGFMLMVLIIYNNMRK